MEEMFLYHGSDKTTINTLVKGNIDVSKGGGEIGQGFYLGNWLTTARTWAHHKYKDASVLEVKVQKKIIFNLNFKNLSRERATRIRRILRRRKIQRIYRFNKDIIKSPIVGSSEVIGDQFKWESQISENLLNSNIVQRREI